MNALSSNTIQDVATKQWLRYSWVRDNGHSDYVKKADLCERNFRGDQWDAAAKEKLRQVRRPAVTINKIISTISNIMGEQIYNRSEISFRPRRGSSEGTADILSKVFKYVSDNNQLDWKRSDMFADGIITSRGFLDMRMSFEESLQGDIVIDNINPKNVLIDPDADQYDPDTWGEVFTTKWLTCDDIELLYGKEHADVLRGRLGGGSSGLPYGFDSIDYYRDRFGDTHNPLYLGGDAMADVMRSARIIERQYRQMSNQLHFVQPKTGETRAVPDSWDKARVAMVEQEFGLRTIKKKVRRIRWTVTADNIVLHDDWSPYKHYTVIPYFPYLRHGKTIGCVENLIDPQELLNKTSSQELHIVNTTANSGYIVKTGSLTTMSTEELEARGAETGIVIEVNDDVEKSIKKIIPNAVPTGIDNISRKAEGHIDSISGVSESAKGFDREDVAAKAIQEKRKAGATNLAKPLDSLVRTDWLIARNAVDLIQAFFTEERVLTITSDSTTGATEDITINQIDPATGTVLNDLMIGEFSVVVSSVPQRETLEDSQFDQAVSMKKELGIAIPDKTIIEASRLRNKKELLKDMEAIANSAAAQEQAQLQKRMQEAEISKIEAEAGNKQADTGLRAAKTQKETVSAQKEAAAGDPAAAEMAIKEQEAQLTAEKHQADLEFEQRKMELEERKAELELQLKREAGQQDMAIKQQSSQQDMQLKAQAQAAQQAQQRAARMTQSKPAK